MSVKTRNFILKPLLAVLITTGLAACNLGYSANHQNQPQDTSVDDALLNPPINLALTDLESDYEQQFCQLNNNYGITLSSSKCQDKITYIANDVRSGNFNLNNQPITNNSAGVSSVLFESLSYTTTVNLPNATASYNVSGGLFLPQGIKKPKGIIVYFHGTTFDNSTVPSNINDPSSKILAEILASNGYVVVAPDYIGHGVDWRDVHPYILYPEVNAKTAIDMLNSVMSYVSSSYGLNSNDSLNLFSIGFSEGGAYSLWFNNLLTENPNLLNTNSVDLQLTHSVGMEGAYDLSNTMYNFLINDVSTNPNTYNIQSQELTGIAKPPLLANALLAFASYSDGANYADVFNMSWFDLNCIIQLECNYNNSHQNIAQVFRNAEGNPEDVLVTAALDRHGNNTSYLIDPASSANSIIPLVNQNALTYNSPLYQAMQAADVDLSNSQSGQISLISLQHDSIVSPNNYQNLLTKYPNNIDAAYLIDETQLPVVSSFSDGLPVYVNVDHLGVNKYELIYALNLVNQHNR